MPTSVTMPRLGESVSEGTVTRWLKSEGERVEVDEPLLEVSTDKVDTEIPSPVAGVLQRIVVAEDATVEVGAELAVIDDGGDDAAGTDGGSAEAGDGQAQADDDPAVADGGDGGQPEGTDGSGTAPAEQPEATADQPEAAPEQPSAEAPAEQPPAGASAEPAAATPDADQPAAGSDDGDAAQAGSESSAGGTPVRMPALGESVTEGTVTRWLKEVGDRVEADEPLVEVSTDKVDTEIPSPVAGTLRSITADTDATVEVGGELAVIDEGGAAAGPSTADAPAAPGGDADQPAQAESTQEPPAQPARSEPTASEPEPARPAAAAPAAAPPAASRVAAAAPQTADSPAKQPASGEAPQRSGATPNGQAAYVTPLVRKLASQHGVDLATLRGTGVGGRIRKQDILDAAEAQRAAARPGAATSAPAPAPAPQPVTPSPLRGTTEKMSRLRAVIARRMVESLQTSAQLTTVVEVDVTRVARLRQQAKEGFLAQHGVKLSFLPFFAVAAVEALRVYPKINATVDLDQGSLTYPAAEHLGIAVDTERGLLVPVIRDAGDLNLGGMARKIADLAERTRANKVSPDELSGGTFTLTNTGSRGALFDTPIINQPQSAILGTGAVVKRAAVVDDPELGEVIVPRSTVYLALSYDHRVVDGADAARFLVAVKNRLETAAFDAELGLD